MTRKVKRGEAADRIFAEADVDLISTGQVHVPFALPITPGDHCSCAVGCGTISHRELGQPPSFNRIEGNADHIIVTATARSGRQFDPHHTRKLPRRQDTRRTSTTQDPEDAGPTKRAAV